MLHAAYFEVGNEPLHVQSGVPLYPGYQKNYPAIFYGAALGLISALGYRNHDLPFYRILTAGFDNPSASTSQECVLDQPPRYKYKNWDIPRQTDPTTADPSTTHANIVLAEQAILEATTGQPYPHFKPLPHLPIALTKVSRKVLGVAVHPYGYVTHDAAEWQNYFPMAPATPGSPCQDLGNLNHLWTTTPALRGLPLVYTEINFVSGSNRDNPNAMGAYIVDLDRYLQHHRHQIAVPLRVMVYEGVNEGAGYLGLYAAKHHDSDNPQRYLVDLKTCPRHPELEGPKQNGSMRVPLSTLYKIVARQGGCG